MHQPSRLKRSLSALQRKLHSGEWDRSDGERYEDAIDVPELWAHSTCCTVLARRGVVARRQHQQAGCANKRYGGGCLCALRNSLNRQIRHPSRNTARRCAIRSGDPGSAPLCHGIILARVQKCLPCAHGTGLPKPAVPLRHQALGANDASAQSYYSKRQLDAEREC